MLKGADRYMAVIGSGEDLQVVTSKIGLGEDWLHEIAQPCAFNLTYCCCRSSAFKVAYWILAIGDLFQV